MRTMKREIPSGLGQPVGPLIRVLAALLGLIGVFNLGLAAILFFLGAPIIQLNLMTVADLVISALLVFYGFGIGLKGRAPNGIWPWK